MNTAELKEVVLSKTSSEQRENLKAYLEQPEMEEVLKKLVELSNNQEFLSAMVRAKDGIELQKIAMDNGIQMDRDGADTAFEIIQAECDTELTEDDLDKVAGGFCVAGMIIAGLVIGGVLGVVATAGYAFYRKTSKDDKKCK